MDSGLKNLLKFLVFMVVMLICLKVWLSHEMKRAAEQHVEQTR